MASSSSERRARRKQPARVPADLVGALQKNKKAKAAFDAFSPSHKREYVEWITEASAMRRARNAFRQPIEWIAEGKSRNWKYQ